MFGIFLVLTQFMQAVLGYSALAAAGSLLPMMVVMMPLSADQTTVNILFGVGYMDPTAGGTSDLQARILAGS